MGHENFIIKIDGKEIPELYNDLHSFEVELDDELACMFRMRITILLGEDGVWTYLDDERFMVWKQVTISAGFEGNIEELITGYITHIKPGFDCDPCKCILEIWGIDGSILMDREERLKDWPSMKDSDIASKIFNRYGFTPEVEDTHIVHDEAVSTIIQRETDMQFLKRLALRNGFECYVEGTTGYFRTAQVDATPQPILAVNLGDETNVINFSVEINALMPANVSMFQVDRINKDILDVSADTSQQPPLGKIDTGGLLAKGMNPAQVYIGRNCATGHPEMEALCQGLFQQAVWFVTGEGEITGNQYGHVLKPRGTVTIKGVNKTYSGIYYITHVTHSFTTEGYTQSFKVKRNGIMTTGSEDFSGPS